MILDKNLQSIFQTAFDFAEANNHLFVTPEHILCVGLVDDTVKDLLDMMNVSVMQVGMALTEYLETKIPTTIAVSEEDKKTDEKKSDKLGPFQSEQLTSLFDLMSEHAAGAEKEFIDITDFLISIMGIKDCYAAWTLQKQGVTQLKMMEAISELNYPRSADSDDDNGDGPSGEEIEQMLDMLPPDLSDEEIEEAMAAFGVDKNNARRKSPLEKWAHNLTEMAENKELDTVVGRDEEIERTLQVLCRRTKNNPLHVGDAGVGKTAIANGIAQRIVKGDVPDKLKDFQVYSLDMTALMAGTRYRGDFEERIEKLTKELLKLKNVILYIDEIHTVIGAGSSTIGNSGPDASNLLKPFLTHKNFRCMGATTYEEFKKSIEKDAALLRRFQKIDINEPGREDTIKILKGLKNFYEEHHNVTFTKEAIVAAVDLSTQAMSDRRLPDKAIDVLDEAGAMVTINRWKGAKKQKEAEVSADPVVIDVPTIEEVVAKLAKVPVHTVKIDEREQLRTLEETIKKRVFGQDEAVRLVTQSVKRSRAGFRSAEKPSGVFLFAGPTGVGKTELARALADTLGLELIRFDMSEYQEKHTVSRLVGSPPGYVGYEEGGLLTDAIRKQPHAVLLLDEIEKAHHDIYNVLLQIMDYAQLTDSQGRKADFHNVFIIMTSNAGGANLEKPLIGFGDRNQTSSVIDEAVKNTFTPEFRNRLDAVVPFGHLARERIDDIVNKEIRLLNERLADRKVKIKLTKKCVSYLAELGYSKEYGARNIARVVDSKISTPLVDEVLFGQLSGGGTVTCDAVTDKDGKTTVAFKFKEPKNAAKDTPDSASDEKSGSSSPRKPHVPA